MSVKVKWQRAAKIAYSFVAAFLILTLVYLSLFENVSVYQTRTGGTDTVIRDCSVREIPDSEAPVGIRKEYTFTLNDISEENDCLGFYLVHHYAEVYIEGELVYRLMPDENNKIAKGVSSNWAMIPLRLEDNGKEIRVIATPVYSSVVDRAVEFRFGSQHSIWLNRLLTDLPQLILALLCIVLGLVILVVWIGFALTKKNIAWYMFYLSHFSILLGLSRITDTRFSPLLFTANPLVLGYISIGMLFLTAIPVLLFVHECFRVQNVSLLVTAVLACVAVGAVTVCQIFGLAEWKPLLPIAHIMIILCGIVILITLLCGKKEDSKKMWQFLFLILIGVALDILSFYVMGNSSGAAFTEAMFCIYTVVLFVSSLSDVNRIAYTESMTGFFNRNYWDTLMKRKGPVSEDIGVAMLDLNRLKYTNDTLGHEAGDAMIRRFSNILRNSIPKSNTICRWGGDEFTVLFSDSKQESVEACLNRIHEAVNEYNASGAKPEIHYAAGYALSSELPGLSRSELLKVADGRMYKDKQRWYDETGHPRPKKQ